MKSYISFFLFLIINIGYTQNSQLPNHCVNVKELNVYEKDYFEFNKDVLGLSNETVMQLSNTNVDKKGIIHSRYHQYHKGLRVIGGTYMLHSKKSAVFRTNGSIYPNINVDTKPQLDENEVFLIASEYLKQKIQTNKEVIYSSNIQIENEGISLCIIDKAFPKFSKDYRLAYECILSTNSRTKPIKRVIYVDAKTGNEINSFSKIMEETVPGKGQSNFYGVVNFDHDSIAPTEFYMRDKSRGDGIYIYDEQTNSLFFNDKSFWDFQDPWKNTSVDVMYATQKFYDFLKDRFNYNSIDNKGFNLVSNVNIPGYVNAFWNGQTTNFGTGDCHDYNPLTNLEIVGHEFAHGFTEFHSNLIYDGESGGLNEAMSDIFGKSLEYYTVPASFTWIIGNDIPKHAGIKPIRSMSNPNDYKNPKYYGGLYWDFDEVHNRSGVFNYWYYLLAQGDMGINEGGDTFDVKSIGIEKALELAFQLNAFYLNESSTYLDAYEYSKEAADDLFGKESSEYGSVIEAWKAVGIGGNIIKTDEYRFEVIINGDPSPVVKACTYADTLVLEITLVNASEVLVPESSKVYYVLNGQYYNSDLKLIDKKFLDTTFITDIEIGTGEGFVFTTQFQIYTHEFLNKLDLTHSIEIVNDSIIYADTIENTVEVVTVLAPEESYELAFEDLSISDKCAQNQQVQYFAAVVNKSCSDSDPAFSYELTGIKGNTKGFMNYIPYNSSFFFIMCNFNLDSSKYGPLKDIVFNIYLEAKDEKFLIYSNNIGKNFSEPLSKGSILDFQTAEIPGSLSLSRCLDCLFSIKDNSLLLSESSENSKLEDCMTIEDYFDSELDFRNSSTVGFCTDLTDMKEPVLSFEVKMLNILNDIPKEIENYVHLMVVSQDQKAVSPEIITSTNDKFTIFEFPLEPAASTQIDFDIISKGADVYFDNIQIYDKSVATNEIALTSIYINNPVCDVMTIENNDYSGKWNIQILNLNGQKVYENNAYADTHQIDCRSLPNGLYCYNIETNNKTYKGKIIIMH